MRVFLTGSTGLLGVNTVHALLARGHEVLALARDPDKARRVLPADKRVCVVPGDVEAPDAWLGRLADADALIHAAAYFREYYGRGDHAAKLRTINVELPARLARACDEFGLTKSIMVSSSGVVTARPDGRPSDETGAPASSVPGNAYFESKAEMERDLARLAPDLAHVMVVARPGWMFGPNDTAPTSAGQLVKDLLRQRSVQLIGGPPMGIADARDVAEGMVLALEKADRPGVYNLAGNPLPAIDALREVARQAGPGHRVQQVPLPAAFMLSAVLEAFSRARGVPNPIPRMGLLTLSRGVLISSEKAERELGVRFRPFAETARDTVAYFHSVDGSQSARRE
jgi:dihydroflavonol-4-reductase